MTLKTQEYIIKNGIDSLEKDFSIKITKNNNLLILNYDQIKSPKTHEVVKECRGLILEDISYNLIAKSFNRFFNWGECQDDMKLFNFNNFIVNEKLDGSLCIIYNYNDKWYANTKGSFALDKIQGINLTWQDCFCKALQVNSLQELTLDKRYTYICEFVSPYNKIVRQYNNCEMYLLTVFNKEKEFDWDFVDDIAKKHFFNLKRPDYYKFNCIDEIIDFINFRNKKDPTFEGVVILDDNFNRWKIKSPTYLSWHKLRGNGENMFMPKNLFPFVVSGETDELLVYYPEVKETLFDLKNKYDFFINELNEVWNNIKNIESQKDFATIAKKYKFSFILFFSRKFKKEPIDIVNEFSEKVLDEIL